MLPTLLAADRLLSCHSPGRCVSSPSRPRSRKRFFPARDGRRSRVELFLGGVVGEAVGEQQQDLGAQHEAGGKRLRACNLVELSVLLEIQLNGFAFKRHTERKSPL